jgi:hypothetical protein
MAKLNKLYLKPLYIFKNDRGESFYYDTMLGLLHNLQTDGSVNLNEHERKYFDKLVNLKILNSQENKGGGKTPDGCDSLIFHPPPFYDKER